MSRPVRGTTPKRTKNSQPRASDISSSAERSPSSSADDIRSFCAPVTNFFSRSFMYFSPSNVPTSSKVTMPTQSDTSSVISSSNPHGYGRSFFELSTDHTSALSKSRVVFEAHNEVQELYTQGNVPSFEKQSQRGTTNPWRKYGALKKLHEIGGTAPPGNTRDERRNKNGFIDIKKGTRPPPPPRCPEVTLNRDRRHPGLIGRIQLPRNVPAEQLSQAIAWEIKGIVEAEPMSTSPVYAANRLENLHINDNREWQNAKMIQQSSKL
ncbi:hypothetical protein V3C99_008360 [Haemonchus contortus]|uniref:Uncharacterized protein n=1 Tax=Haemonchus contortus TaxID=6289 RepID=A0A7I4YKW3_HAECO